MSQTDTPTDTVTFLFTDIEGSTRLWEAHPAAMQAALARHDAMLRDVLETAGGTIFKTMGDAFYAVFARAPDAVCAAAHAQIALQREAWPAPVRLAVRMALHTGAAQKRDGDYFGLALSQVARLLSAAHGGQILVSAATQEASRDTLPEEIGLRNRGAYHLKDVALPETIYQLVHPDLPPDFPPLRTPENTPNNLPPPLTSFIGREKERDAVRALLLKTRLLTLTGTGGAGKTRLALEIAADTRGDYPDGTWLVELAPLSDPALVPHAVALALGIKEQAGQEITQTLAHALKTKCLLLLLDNGEHLIRACAALVSQVLRACPTVRVLATSREALAIGGEQVYRVPSLSLPDPKRARTATPEMLGDCEAVRLFVARARQVRSDFALTNNNAPAVAELCCQLDGIPLAIELAAARVRSLPVEEISQRLDRRFRLLTGGDRSALPRQQTLRALIDWSYDLLSEPEKRLLARLSVFAGGWTLAAAEIVCGFTPLGEGEILDLLTSLTDKSLVLAGGDDGEGGATLRYRLQETLRQYAGEKRAVAAPSENSALVRRHQDWFLALAEKAEARLTGPEQAVWLARLEAEHDNFRAALDNNAAENSAEAGEGSLRLAGALWWFWSVRGHFAEGRQHLARVLRAPDTTIEARIKALNGAGGLAYTQGDYPAARVWYEECLALSRALGDTKSVAALLGNLGGIAQNQGEPAPARTLFEESLALRRALNDQYGIAHSLGNLAGVLPPGEAQPLYEESILLSRALGDKHGVALSLGKRGNLALSADDFVGARALLEESLVLFRELGDRQGIAYSLEGIASVRFNVGETRAAVVLLGAAAALREDVGAPLSPGEQAGYRAQLAHARAILGDAFSSAWDQGRALGLESAIDRALAVPTVPASG